MTGVAVVSFAQTDCMRDAGALNEVELIMPVVSQALGAVGLGSAQDVDFTCSGSCDYQQGAAFAFVLGVDALGAVPPIVESHVEMDAAWALFEAILKIRMGHADSALVYGFGKSSPGELPVVLSQQLDPYYLAPLFVDNVSLAAMQARMMLEQGACTEMDMAEVVARSRRNAKANNERAQLAGDVTASELLQVEPWLDPLRRHDCCPISDGASAMVVCTEAQAKAWGVPYALITGIEHRIETHNLGARDLTRSVSTEQAAAAAGVGDGPVDVAELYAPFSHQEIILTRALGLAPGQGQGQGKGGNTSINPSGGVLAGNLMMASGLSRVGEVARRIIDGSAGRGVAHATSGPCLQHNLVTVLEAAA